MTDKEKSILQQYDIQEILEYAYESAEFGSSLYKFHLTKDELKLFKGYRQMAKQLKNLVKKEKELQTVLKSVS